jgi:hypothetical protein
MIICIFKSIHIYIDIDIDLKINVNIYIYIEVHIPDNAAEREISRANLLCRVLGRGQLDKIKLNIFPVLSVASEKTAPRQRGVVYVVQIPSNIHIPHNQPHPIPSVAGDFSVFFEKKLAGLVNLPPR